MSHIGPTIVPDDKTIIHNCVMSQEQYMGLCPVTACPANISASSRKGGCMYVFLNYKKVLSHHELSYVTGLSLKETKRRIEEGEKAISNVLLLHGILTRLRDHNRLASCPKCGILRKAALPCFNTLMCKERQEKVEHARRGRPLNIPELEITNQDMFLMLDNIGNMLKFLRAARPNADNKLSLATLFNIPRDEMRALKELRTRYDATPQG